MKAWFINFLPCPIKCTRNVTVDSDVALVLQFNSELILLDMSASGNVLNIEYSIW